MPSRHPTRREMIQASLAAAAVAGLSRPLRAGDEPPAGFAVRKVDPLNAEPSVDGLNSYVTPVEGFFIRSHHPRPAPAPDAPVAIGGMVDRPTRYSPGELRAMPWVTLPAVLQCSGNSRFRFDPPPSGVAWHLAAVGNAEWTGVPLKAILGLAGIQKGAKHVHFRGRDEPPEAGGAPFLRSLPIARAMDPSTLLTFGMNGQDLPPMHGGPIRLAVPGWVGNHWMKWLREVTVSDEEAPGSFQRVDYRLPTTPKPPGAEVPPEETVPVTTLNVKSLITSPADEARVDAGKVTIEGAAWTGTGRVAKVEVSLDGGEWQEAELFGPDHLAAWRRWRIALDAKPGAHRARARATDTTGAVQPDATPWNKGGYLWNGIEAVRFTSR